MSSANSLCKQFGPRSKLFDTLIIFLKFFFEKVDFEKSADDKVKVLSTALPVFVLLNILVTVKAAPHEYIIRSGLIQG